MAVGDWVSVCEFTGAAAAALAAERLEEHGIPCKVMNPGNYRDLTRCVWVAPDRALEAKTILARDEVPEDDLTKEALRYPPPDDA
jgi:hypothetical protein